MKIISKNVSLTCELPERLDTLNSQEFEAELNKSLDANLSKITFDCVNVNFISSYFLRICLNLIKQYGKDNFSIINIKPDIKKVFIISGFDKLIKLD